MTWRCGPHIRGLAPGDARHYHPDCVVCRRLKAEGKRTGDEPLPADLRRISARQRSQADWKLRIARAAGARRKARAM